jgi:pSer/pThr/pTyr-binding forkhead associated (FHA) protein
MNQPQSKVQSGSDFTPLQLILKPTGLTITINRPETIVGRHSEADIRLPLPDVSRRHCRISYHAGNWHVTDLQSLNGVFVNGDRCRESRLEHDDEIRIGGFTFVVDLRSGRSSQADAQRYSVFTDTPGSQRRAS